MSTNKYDMMALVSGGAGDVSGYYADLAAREAQYDHDFEMLDMQQQFNSAEAQKNRDWQTEMSNTAYQRAAADMEAAGLNRLMAVSGQASTPAASSASSSGSASTYQRNHSHSESLGNFVKVLSKSISTASKAFGGSNSAKAVELLGRIVSGS